MLYYDKHRKRGEICGEENFMRKFLPDKEVNCMKIKIPRRDGKTIPALVVSPKTLHQDAPARQADYSGLPPTYTFVGNGEPFYSETCTYIENLKNAGVEAKLDIYKSNMHAFDMMKPDMPISKEAAAKFNEQFAYTMKHYFAENEA